MLHHVTSYHTSYHTSLYIHDVTSYYNILHLPDLRNLPNLHNLPSSSGSVVGPMGDDSGSAWPGHRRGRPGLGDLSDGGDAHQAAGGHQQQHGLRLHVPWLPWCCAMSWGAYLIYRSILIYIYIWFYNMFQWLILIDIIWYYMIFLRREDHNPWAANNPFSQSLDAPLSSPNTENQG